MRNTTVVRTVTREGNVEIHEQGSEGLVVFYKSNGGAVTKRFVSVHAAECAVAEAIGGLPADQHASAIRAMVIPT